MIEFPNKIEEAMIKNTLSSDFIIVSLKKILLGYLYK